MSTIRNFTYLLVMLGVTSVLSAKTTHWETIRSYLLEGTSDAYKKLDSYVKSLDADELIIAGKQCSVAGDTLCPDSIFCEETLYMLAFFYQEYPKRDSMASIDHILDEIVDKKQTNFWRASLIDFLGNDDWLSLLSSEQQYSAVDKLLAIIPGTNEDPWLRYEAIKTTDKILEYIEKSSLLAEPNIQEKMKKGHSLEQLRKEVYHGNIKLSESCKKACTIALRVRSKFINKLLIILKEQNLHRAIQRGILTNLKDSLSKPMQPASEVQKSLENAVRNYKKCDKFLWHYLARIGYENLRMSDIPQITEKMLDDMQNELKAEKEKGKKCRIKSEIDSL